MEEFVLVIVTSETCGHCHRYLSQQHQSLINKLSSAPNLSIIHLAFNSGNETVEKILKGSSSDGNYSKYLDNIKKFIRWYPEFMLFKKRSLFSKWTPGTKIDMWILNASISSDPSGNMTIEPIAGIPLTADGISSWVLSKMSENSSSSTIKPGLSKIKKSPEIPHADILQSRGHGFVKPFMPFNLSSDIED